MDSMWTLMDVIVLGSGLYSFYAIYLMKMHKIVKTTFLLTKDYDIKKCKDLDGYIECIYKKYILFASACVFMGGCGLINTYVMPFNMIYLVASVIFFVILLWFGLMARNATRIYF